MASPLAVIEVVHGDESTRRRLTRLLRRARYRVVATADTETAQLRAPRRPFDVIVVALADRAGLGVLARLRTQAHAVIALAAPGGASVAQALDAGADDCLVEPVDPDELLARLRAVVRRARGEVFDGLVVSPDFTIDLAERRLMKEGREVHLTPTEWRLMELLARHPDRLVNHDQMLKAVWGPAKADRFVYLRVYVAALRRKLEPDRSMPVYLLTEHGFGYRFRPGGAGSPVLPHDDGS